MTGAAKVHDAHCTPLGVAQKNVLRFQVAVDDLDFGRGQEQQGRAQLLGKLARLVQLDAPEVGVAQELVEVVGQQLKHEAQVIAIHEMTFHANCVRECNCL